MIEYDSHSDITRIFFKWKSFKIDRIDFEKTLSQLLQNYDGLNMNEIVNGEVGFKVCIKGRTNQAELNLIEDLYNSLNEVEETRKILFPSLLEEAKRNRKGEMIFKVYDELDVIERKILLNLELTKVEELELVSKFQPTA